MMTMKKLNPIGRYITQDLIGFINHLIDWNNALEARLSVLEHPVERLSEETRPTGKVSCSVCKQGINIGHQCSVN